MRILGIDPGFEKLGIAILEKNKNNKKLSDKNQHKEKVLFSECFRTSAELGFHERLFLIGQEIKKVMKKWKPDVLAIETLFLNTNQKTVMRVAEARGVVIYEASTAGLKIFEASPLQIKIAITGYGRANKEQVMKMVKILVETDNLKTRSLLRQESDDEIDAIAMALTAFAHTR